jgi:hypothetical protein
MDTQLKNASIGLGNIWFSPGLQRTQAASQSVLPTVGLRRGACALPTIAATA